MDIHVPSDKGVLFEHISMYMRQVLLPTTPHMPQTNLTIKVSVLIKQMHMP